jgi:uncharacterized protein YqgC (DUF456 family)
VTPPLNAAAPNTVSPLLIVAALAVTFPFTERAPFIVAFVSVVLPVTPSVPLILALAKLAAPATESCPFSVVLPLAERVPLTAADLGVRSGFETVIVSESYK